MPELPEVETMRRGLAHYILNKRFKAVEVRNTRLRYPVDDVKLNQLKGETIVTVDRRAKYLIIKTENYQLLIHLGMTGVLHCLDADFSPRKHDHIIFTLNDQSALFYNDTRRFGSVQLYRRDEAIPAFDHLAPEPLEDEFNVAYLRGILEKRKRMIKPTLMDQSLVVGVGNIYANEVLFLSGIHPKKASNNLDLSEIESVVNNIKKVLKAAIKQGGTTLKDFTNPDGEPGYFSQELNVYGKEGDTCPQCGAIIIREVINQRATYWCDQCQKM